MPFVNPTREQFKSIYGIPDGQPVGMLNLLKFREQAQYAEGDADASPAVTGREAYERYSAAAEEVFRKSGGRQSWIGKPQAGLIGPGDESWDLAFVAYYPSAKAFTEMVKSEAYQSASRHRTAGVADARLIVCSYLEAGPSFAPRSDEAQQV